MHASAISYYYYDHVYYDHVPHFLKFTLGIWASTCVEYNNSVCDDIIEQEIEREPTVPYINFNGKL